MNQSREMMLDAVKQYPLISWRGPMERAFALWFSGFIYNQVWEDPRVDLAALELTSDSRVVTIASGGCNILNYLTQAPATITAVDLNPHHVQLTKLKLAALRYLPSHQHFFDFFARANLKENRLNYFRHVSAHLDEAAQAYWEGPWLLSPLRGPRINFFTRNLYDCARNGIFLRVLHEFARLSGYNLGALFETRNALEREQVFDREIAPFFDHPIIKLISKFPVTLFGLGVPPQQLAGLAQEEGKLLNAYRARVKRLACDFPIEDNYFCWQALLRRYDVESRRSLPDYLKEDNFSALRQNAVSARVEVSSLISFLRAQASSSMDRFVLLDIQDWMKPEKVAALWMEIMRVAKRDSRVIFRTAGSISPVEHALDPSLLSRLIYERELSTKLHKQDRSAIYGGFHLYRVNV